MYTVESATGVCFAVKSRILLLWRVVWTVSAQLELERRPGRSRTQGWIFSKGGYLYQGSILDSHFSDIAQDISRDSLK